MLSPPPSYVQDTMPGVMIELADATVVARMRTVLALAMLLTVIMDLPGTSPADNTTRLLFSGYALHSAWVWLRTKIDPRAGQNRLVQWLDVGWFALLLYATDGARGFLFLSFFFAIVAASFRWGFGEGARMTIASVMVLGGCGMLAHMDGDLLRVLLRAGFLLALGYMSAYWGESKLVAMRRLALLQQVAQLSNPRFGIDQSLAGVLARVRAFFQADCVLLVLRDGATGKVTMQSSTGAGPRLPGGALSPELAAALTALPEDRLIVSSRNLFGKCRTLATDDTGQEYPAWKRPAAELPGPFADLLGGRAFISVPVVLPRGSGWLYVVTGKRRYDRTDGLFLAQVVRQVFPVLENIELLDRMASAAASQERRRIAWDLHDSAVQPYIALRLALGSLRNKAAPDNPLTADIDRLVAMSGQVIDGLRNYAVQFHDAGADAGAAVGNTALLANLEWQARQASTLYGLAVEVAVEDAVVLNDRLAAQVAQIVHEGLSNIGRHTQARRALVLLRCSDGWLTVRIANDGQAQPCQHFTPRSITERARALGGHVQVRAEPGRDTIVEVDIPT